MELGEREIIYLSIHCHHQNDSCIKMGSDESHFNVSVGSDGHSHRTVSTNHNLFEEKGEPKRVSNRGPSAYQPNALPLGQTGSLGQAGSGFMDLYIGPWWFGLIRCRLTSGSSALLQKPECEVVLDASLAVKVLIV